MTPRQVVSRYRTRGTTLGRIPGADTGTTVWVDHAARSPTVG